MSLGMSFARRRMMANGGSAVDPILNNNPWDVISEISTAGEAANFWSVGDRKAIVLNGTVGILSLSNYTVYAFIIGFDHNASLEGAGRIHFQIGKTALSGGMDVALCDSQYDMSGSTGGFRINLSIINSGWNGSYMRKTICPKFKNILPDELKNVIKRVTKYTNNVVSSTAEGVITATMDEIFLLAEYEVFGTVTYGSTSESSKQKQYEYYLAGNSKVKRRHSSTSRAAEWWLRSPRNRFMNQFVCVGDNGAASISFVTDSEGFAPAFCV